jgi:hypothetical protein
MHPHLNIHNSHPLVLIHQKRKIYRTRIAAKIEGVYVQVVWDVSCEFTYYRYFREFQGCLKER